MAKATACTGLTSAAYGSRYLTQTLNPDDSSHFADEKIEAQSSEVTCSKSYRW